MLLLTGAEPSDGFFKEIFFGYNGRLGKTHCGGHMPEVKTRMSHENHSENGRIARAFSCSAGVPPVNRASNSVLSPCRTWPNVNLTFSSPAESSFA